MRLSKETVEVLKNFSTINQNIMVKEGNKLRTISTMKNILAEADVSEVFPSEFGIYDLNEFLGAMSLADGAELNFDNDKYLLVNGGSTEIKYMYSDPSILTTPPETFNPPACDVTVDVSQSVLDKVLKASAVMQLPDVVFTNGTITATDLKNSTSNNFTEKLEGVVRDLSPHGLDDPFEAHFKAENLKMVRGDYKVDISTTAKISNWKGDVASYWIAMEAKVD